MRHLDISLGFICQGGVYLLQKRANDPKIGAAGRIGAFGGKIEADETPIEAARRELAEETNLTPVAEDLKYIGEIDLLSDHQLEDVTVHATVYCMQVAPRIRVQALEGTLVAYTKIQALEQLDKLTPATRLCFEQLIEKGN